MKIIKIDKNQEYIPIDLFFNKKNNRMSEFFDDFCIDDLFKFKGWSIKEGRKYITFKYPSDKWLQNTIDKIYKKWLKNNL